MSHVSNESQRISTIISELFSEKKRVTLKENSFIEALVGSGDRDDCAVFKVTGEFDIVFGSDYVRGPKFDLFSEGLLTYYDLGYYLVVANISDIAAMGGVPFTLSTVVRYPKDMSDADFKEVLLGIRDASKKYGCFVSTGDIGTAERLILSASAIGIVESDRSLTRKGTRPGDFVCLTGPVGTPGSALLYFTKLSNRGIALSDLMKNELLSSWSRPEARVEEGIKLSQHGIATSCMDVSDGLKSSLIEIASQNGVGILAFENEIPVEASVRELAAQIGVDLVALASSASVDFELLFTVSKNNIDLCRHVFNEMGSEFYIIGQITNDSQIKLKRSDGTISEFPGIPWEHQSDSLAEYLLNRLNSNLSNKE